MVGEYETLETKSLVDFISRMQRGTIFYFFAWFVPAFVFKFYSVSTTFFYVTSAFCIITTLFRVYICSAVKADVYTNTKKKKNLAIMAVSSSAVLWGAMYAFILGHDVLENSLLGITVITGMIAASAAALLSIYKLASLVTQIFILVPGMLVITSQYYSNEASQTHVFLWCALAVSFVYLRQVYNTAHNDYINSSKNQLLAEIRAQKMEYLSIRDPLTKLKNRLFFDSHLEEAWLEAHSNNTMISLIMIDLDHFKKINDTHGHLIGDECLRAVAKSLKENLRQEGDHLARFGGEEFILCLQDSTPQRTLLIAERLLQCIRDTEIILKAGKINLTCSIGLANTVVNNSESVDDLLTKADEALYKAKENGRNQIFISKPKLKGTLLKTVGAA